MIGDDLSDFLHLDEFAIEVTFNSTQGLITLLGLFDREGSFVDGIVLENARFISETSIVDKKWTCTIDGDTYEVLYKEKGSGNYAEYVLERTTSRSSRNIS